MGISIHYRGRLDCLDLLVPLCNAATGFAQTMGWPAFVIDDDWGKPPDAAIEDPPGVIQGHLGLKGVQVTPHAGSESLALFFDRDGYLRSPMTMLFILNGTFAPENKWISMKTQFSSSDTHVRVIALLRYLKAKYIHNLEVSDEGGYWDTEDRKALERNMSFINSKIKQFSSALSSLPVGNLKDLSADEIATRIEQLFLTESQKEFPPQSFSHRGSFTQN
jgi:hypothetical protein